MANSSDQACSSVPNMRNLLLPPKFVSLMKSVRKAKSDAETFASKIDLLARQYSRGFDEILREGAKETRDGIICEIATEIDMEASRYSGKLEDFKTKLKNVFGNHDNNSQSSLPGDSLKGIHEDLRDRMIKLQQEILDMKSSNTAFQKRFEDAKAQNAERVQEVTALRKQLGEALESNRKLKDDLMQITVRPVAATVDGSVQTYDTDFTTMCSQLELEFYNLMNKYKQHEDSLEAVKEEMLEEIRILDAKINMEICEKAGSVAHLRYVKSLAHDRVVLSWMKTQIEQLNMIKFQHFLAI